MIKYILYSQSYDSRGDSKGIVNLDEPYDVYIHHENNELLYDSCINVDTVYQFNTNPIQNTEILNTIKTTLGLKFLIVREIFI